MKNVGYIISNFWYAILRTYNDALAKRKVVNPIVDKPITLRR